jgi:ADP-ribosylglycohydrolase
LSNIINLAEYKDKVLGCWAGKNIGGTLGAPFEMKQEMQNVSFYTQNLNGQPTPNDDLDLQLVWLYAAEKHGVYNLNERLLAEYWMQSIIGPWNEYAVCRANISNGLYPPLSGSCNNGKWHSSNGAWIRSEIWACIFPGEPDVAAHFAYMDACVDHCGDGIFAEMFTAALESAAFVVSDCRRLIDIGLSKIPAGSRIARSVRLACELYDKKSSFKDARNAIVKDSKDLGWFQAPANVGFMVLGLLYGEGDFGKSICFAVNCGDDTDCTAATAGAILGIMSGRSGIPDKWLEPIGDSIKTIAIDSVDAWQMPHTLDELTGRVARLASFVQDENPKLLRIGDKPTHISPQYLEQLFSHTGVEHLWSRSAYELTFDLPFGIMRIDYEDGPEISSGESKKLTLSFTSGIITNKNIYIKWRLPADWEVVPSREISLNCIRYKEVEVEQIITPGNCKDAYTYVPLDIRLSDRNNYVTLNIPFQKKGAVFNNSKRWSHLHEGFERHLARVSLVDCVG